MPSHYHVLIVEDDLYALHMMGMLLARDWRTRIVAEVEGQKPVVEIARQVQKVLKGKERIDLVIIDAELIGSPSKPLLVADLFDELQPLPRLLFTATTCDLPFVRRVAALPNFSGYVIKNELLFVLATAAVRAMEGAVVLTPGVERDLLPPDLRPRVQTISCENPVQDMGPREKDIARLGILYNMTQRDIADELVIDSQYVADVMSNIYEILGLHELIRGERPPDEIFQNPIILRKIREIIPAGGGGREHKVPNMPTLAFHLLTEQCIETK
jgi:DNA-binding NarL/FixJ family response regulator